MGSDNDEEKALKANMVDLVIHSSGVKRSGYFISELDDILQGHNEQEIRSAAEELADSKSWVGFNGDYLTVSNKNKARNKIQEWRRDLYNL